MQKGTLGIYGTLRIYNSSFQATRQRLNNRVVNVDKKSFSEFLEFLWNVEDKVMPKESKIKWLIVVGMLFINDDCGIKKLRALTFFRYLSVV